MGWYGIHIGKNHLLMHDSIFDYVKKTSTKEYYEKHKVTLEFKYYNSETNSMVVEDLKYPFTRFCKLIKADKKYTYNSTMFKDNTISKIFFELIKEREIMLIGTISANIYKNDGTIKYFLLSPIGKNHIVLTNVDMENTKHVLVNYEDYIWCVKNGLEFEEIN